MRVAPNLHAGFDIGGVDIRNGLPLPNPDNFTDVSDGRVNVLAPSASDRCPHDAALLSCYSFVFSKLLIPLELTNMSQVPTEIAEVTVATLLKAVMASVPASEPDLMGAAYRDLRAIAGSLLRGKDARQTLQATALVHEAYLKISGRRDTPWTGEAHFIAVAARAMRQIVIDRARARNTAKRGGAQQRETLTGVLHVDAQSSGVLDVHTYLVKLAEIDPRRASVVELRFFAGLSVAEVATVLGVSQRTVELDWRAARAWLRKQIKESGDE